MRYFLLAILAVSSLLAQSRFVYRSTNVIIGASDVNAMILISDVRSRDLDVYVATFPRTNFAVGAKVYFMALTDVPIKISATGGATLISPNNAFRVSAYGSQWELTHIGRNVWVASGDLYTTEVDAYLDDDVALKTRVDPKATGPFKFVWSKNGSVIPGAVTATLKLQRLKYSDSGLYSVTVSNSAGVVSSETLRLLVR
jgi:hypothetical protein